MKRKTLEGWVSKILPLDLSFDGLTQEEVDGALLKHDAVPLLFGRISAETLLEDLRKTGAEEALAERGYSQLRAEIASLPMGHEGLEITALHRDVPERQKLMELKAFWGSLPLPPGSEIATCRALIWDWLELSDPLAEFSPDRPPLPGQKAPGLAMFHGLVRQMREYVALTEAEALVTIPQYFHNAVLYKKDPALGYRFLDPLRRGQMTAQMRDLLAPLGFYASTWAFAEDRVEMLPPGKDEKEPTNWVGFPWTPSELVLPLTEPVRVALNRLLPEVKEGEACRFRVRATPHPDIEGSFHLG